ncbi:3'-5' exonuclease [Kalmusia sp. IMI 367209]|nr:3'-5' exonuclease [Kalmusia sp. IMI 367209]
MAPIELTNLSSNWKKLQKTLQRTTPSASTTEQAADTSKASLKRKRPGKINGEHADKSMNVPAKRVSHKQPVPRKRQKMDEPASVGASIKQHDPKTLSRSVSMPSFKHAPLLASSKKAAESISVLTPSPDFPDVENEGISETALPAKYIALDCEMVGTGPEPDKDSALARVSVVNYHGHQVYDSYVRVNVPVTDYRTAVSGIEPRHLRKDVARPFEDVRNDLKILLDGRILVGHAVKNDLDALILRHDKRYIRDTSKYSKFRELAMIPGRTPSLKILAEKLLGVEIQIGAHSSVEDARATMALFRLEKEGFDAEVREAYGHIKPGATGPVVDVGGGEKTKRKSKPRKKKKKKN